MLATLIIVFREVLEAALVVGIVMAASKGVAYRGRWIAGGIAAGIVGAALVAVFANEIAAAVEGFGQELFNAGILAAAVLMLGWHNVWMSRHGRELAADASRIGREVLAGTRSLRALALVCAIAVLREGSEVVIFLYGIAAAGDATAASMAFGGLLGVAVGVAAGAGIYYGLLSIPVRHLFAVTSLLILLLASGMAAQCAAFLAAADVVPTLGNAVWDTSAFLSDQTLLGKTLHVLIGYTAKPAGIQLVFYAVTFVVIGGAMLLFGGSPSPAKRAQQAAE